MKCRWAVICKVLLFWFRASTLVKSICVNLRIQMNFQSWSLELGQISAFLFPKKVDNDTKSRIASRILALKPSSIAIVTPALNRGWPLLPEITSKKELQDFVTERSILFFERFCPNYGKWLPMNAPWDHIPEFQQDKELVYAIQTVNEPAERMCSILKRFKVLCFWIWTNSHVSDFELPFIWIKLINSFRILALKSPKHRPWRPQISLPRPHFSPPSLRSALLARN